MKIKVVLKDVKIGENGVKAWIAQNIPLHIQKLNCKENIKHCQLHNQNLLH
jgi:hypothetical protein